MLESDKAKEKNKLGKGDKKKCVHGVGRWGLTEKVTFVWSSQGNEDDLREWVMWTSLQQEHLKRREQ